MVIIMGITLSTQDCDDEIWIMYLPPASPHTNDNSQGAVAM